MPSALTGDIVVLGTCFKVEYVLKQLGDKLSGAQQNYREFVRKRIELGNRSELVSGGLLRSTGGWAD
jgi:hypothetical protein